MPKRRHFTNTSPALALPAQAQQAQWDAQVTPPDFDPATSNPWGLHPRLLPTRVEAKDGLRPGDIHVDAVARYLYHIKGDGSAMRYGVAIGRGGLYEPGTFTIRRKAKWPRWTPRHDRPRADPGRPPGHRGPATRAGVIDAGGPCALTVGSSPPGPKELSMSELVTNR